MMKSKIENQNLQEGLVPVYDILNCGPRHRFSANDKIVHNSDKINLQNLPRGGALRQAIRAPKGYKIVACDSSNIELRVAHCLSGQLDTMNALLLKKDLYCEFGSELYGRTITKQDTVERFLSKTAMLGLQYGMGAPKFKESVRIQSKNGVIISDEDSVNIVNLWRRKYNKIPEMWRTCDRALSAIANGSEMSFGANDLISTSPEGLLTPPSNSILLPNLRKENNEWLYDTKKYKTVMPVKIYSGKLLENICQHIARNIIAEQWLEIAKRYRVVLQVHDEIVAIAPEDEAEEAKDFMVSVMSKSPTWWPEIILDAEADIGNSYGEAK